MSSLDRYMDVLRLFDETRSAWTVQEMADALGVPASTVYRSVRDLLAQGWLETSSEARYRLGAAFLEYERLIRVTDPFMEIGRPALRDAVDQARVPCVGLLSRLYNDTVMCVADETSGEDAPHSSYERGRPMPLTRGATSLVVLAQLPARRLAKLLGNVTELKATLSETRRRGYHFSRGEIDPGVAGIAAPVIAPARGLIGSLSLVVDATKLDAIQERRLALLVMSSARLISDALDEPPSSQTRTGTER